MRATQRVATLVVAGVMASALVAAQGGGGRGQAAATNETLSQTFRESHGRDVEYQKSLAGIQDLRQPLSRGRRHGVHLADPDDGGVDLIDSSQEPYVDHVLDNIRNLGFDPKDIKYILIVHGHLDHFGGAARIKELSGARVGLTEADWKMVDDVAKQLQDRPATQPPFNRAVQRDARDLMLKDGDVVTLGKTSLKVYVMPGHTPGSASFEFTVYDNGKPYKAFMFGGPEPRDGVEGGKKFLASVNRLAQMEPDVQVGLLIHSWLANSTYPNGGTFERMVKLQSRKPGEPNPFVDPASWQAWMPKLKMVADKYIADEQAKAGIANIPVGRVLSDPPGARNVEESAIGHDRRRRDAGAAGAARRAARRRRPGEAARVPHQGTVRGLRRGAEARRGRAEDRRDGPAERVREHVLLHRTAACRAGPAGRRAAAAEGLHGRTGRRSSTTCGSWGSRRRGRSSSPRARG